MTIQLTTLGGIRVTRDGRELNELANRSSGAALLVYLAVEKRATRDTVLGMFWPESEPGAARHALRQALYRLRQSLGQDWVESHGPELRIGPIVQTDFDIFHSLIAERDPVGAAKLYGGSFLEGLYLADLPQWETWVEAWRSACRRAFRDACRAWVDERGSAGDVEGAVEAAERWASQDPVDDEAQHALVRALTDAGRRTDAIRQYTDYARALAREDLRPLEETVALVEGLREAGAAESAVRPVGSVRSAPAPASIDSRAGATAPLPSPGSRALMSGLIVGLGMVAVVAALVMGGVAFGPSNAEQAAPQGMPGAFQSGETIVVADFGSSVSDPLLGKVVSDALRIDLFGTHHVRVMQPVEVRETLARMQVPDNSELDAVRAREVALRGGARAVLEGDVSRAGTGYLLTATLRAARGGRSLAAFRESAATEAELIPAIDRLGGRIRERVAGSLATAPTGPPLARVTTSSLDALRLMSAATRSFDRGDYPATIALLEEALELDPDFAMAWRSLGVTLGNTEVDRGRELEAVRRAYELRENLSARERHLATARYHSLLTNDQDAVIAAYRNVLEIDRLDRVALNNLGAVYHQRQQYDSAAGFLRRAVEAPAPSAVAFVNLIEVSIASGHLEEARRAVEAFADRHPHNPHVAFRRFWVRLIEGDEAGAERELAPLAGNPSLAPAVRAQAHDHLARVALGRGQLGLARRHLESAEEIARDLGPAFFMARRLFRAHAETVAGDPARAVSLLDEPTSTQALESLAPADRWHFLRAIVFAMAGRPDRARLVLEEFDRDVPPEFREQFRIRNESARGLIVLLEGEADEAIRILEGIRTSARCRICYAERMGWALKAAGRLEEAAEEWESALAWKDFAHSIEWQFTQNLWTLQRLPALYEELGDRERALFHYRSLVRMWSEADAELQTRVEHARARIAALEAHT